MLRVWESEGGEDGGVARLLLIFFFFKPQSPSVLDTHTYTEESFFLLITTHGNTVKALQVGILDTSIKKLR